MYSQPAGTAGVPGTTIQSTPYNNLVADLGNEVTNSLPTTGVKSMGANLPMGGFRVAAMGDPAIAQDAATKNYVDTATGAAVTYFIGGTTTGTAGVQVLASTSPATFTLTAGYKLSITPGLSNITTLTLQVGALAAKNVFKRSAAGPIALAGGEWVAAQKTTVTYDGTQFLLDEQAILTSPQIITPTLTLKQSAAPAPTVEGDIQWDTVNDVIAVGGSGSTKLFVSIPTGTVAGDIFYAATAKSLARLPQGTASQQLRMNAGGSAPEWFTPPATNGAKAWVSYNGATTTILSSFNVASVTRNGTGDYTINFSTPFADTNYSVVGSAEAESGFPGEIRAVSVRNGGRAVGSVRIRTGIPASNFIDLPGIFIAIFAT